MKSQVLDNQQIETCLPSIDRSVFDNMKAEQKEEYVKKLKILYPKMKQAIDLLENCMKSYKTSEPDCGYILGESRVGKSTIVEEFIHRYPEYDEKGGTVKPVLYSSAPCPAHIKPLIANLLYDMKDPFWNKSYRNTGVLTLRLYELLKKCKVQLIIIDEVQQLVDRERKKLIRESSDWFKDLINRTKIPVVFVGLPESTKIFIENEQLGGRVLLRQTVEPFKYGDKAFRAFLYIFDSQLPFRKTSGLSNLDIWERIFVATNGYIGFVKALLVESTKIAANHNMDSINLPVLAHAYNNKLYFRGPNPFLPGFDLETAIIKLS